MHHPKQAPSPTDNKVDDTPPATYQEFVASKLNIADQTGFEVDPSKIHPSAFTHQRDAILWAARRGRALIAMSFGLGKCHGAGTRLLMADCTVKNVEDIQTGDQLMGDDGTPRTVLSLASGHEQMYRITLKNGDSYTCNGSHVMSLKMSNRYHEYQSGSITTMTVLEYLSLPDYAQRNCFKHYKVSLNFVTQPIPFDPYLYGAWLGDGTRNALAWTINNRDQEIINRILAFAKQHDLDVQERPGHGCKTYTITRRVRGRALHCDEFYFVQGSIDQNSKRLDRRYLQNDRDVRLQVLAGLLDTDGYLIDNCYEIATKWIGLRDDILFLCRSLGLSVTHAVKIVNGDTYYRIYISGDTYAIPCLTRKKATPRKQIKNPLVYGFTVEPMGEGEYFGFELDGNGLYLLADFTVTHNTQIQCELARLIHEQHGGLFLVVCPLGVKHQFSEEDGPRLGVRWQYVRTDAEVEAADTPYLLTNYERVRDGDIDPRKHNLAGVSLDEGSVIRSLGSKTSSIFKEVFAKVPYRFVATATPSPNRFRELIYYADFLDIMDRGQALTRWFQRDTSKAGNLTLHPQHEKDFWLWVATWALFLYTPSDLGYSDEGYKLPELRIYWHRLDVDQRRAWAQTDNRGQHRLFLDAAGGVSEASQEKRATLTDRIRKMTEILADNPDRHWLLWHHLEDERRAIEKAVPESLSVFGSQSLDIREQRIIDFSKGRIPIMATKPEIAGSGCNLQRHCHSNIFLGIDYKFQDFIQAIHRTHRFQQDQPVDVHIIYAESEDAVVEVLRQKWQQHDELVEKMRVIIREYGLAYAAIADGLKRSLGVAREEYNGQLFTAVRNDSVAELPRLADNSIGLIHTSIPFGNHYEYTSMCEDFGHNPTDADFWKQMDYLIPDLLRVLKPGRVAAIHVKDRILYGHQTPHGFMEVAPFSDECVTAFRKHGFLYEGRRTIVTDVVRENNSTYRLGWTEMTHDASKMGSGLPEYLLLFRKPPSSPDTARADEPVTKTKEAYTRARWQIDAHSFWRSDGNRLLTPDERYDYEAHVARLEHMEKAQTLPATFFVEPPESTSDAVWTDVVFMRTLNSRQANGKAEKHICPLPLDIVERVIRLYSNPGDITLDPFAGLLTTGYVAIKMGRRAYCIELSTDYWQDGLRYCKGAEIQALAPTLFDLDALLPVPNGNGTEIDQ